MVDRQQCPDSMTLEKLLQGSIEGKAALELEQHLIDCPRCTDAAASLAGTVSDLGDTAARPADEAWPESYRALKKRLEALWAAGPLSPAADQSNETASLNALRTEFQSLFPGAAAMEPQLGRYQLKQLFGSGGMGSVFLAWDPMLKRDVALKVMKPAIASEPKSRERFLREAQAVAALRHDHVIEIYHVDEDRGVPYLVMPLLKGETLEARQKKTPVFRLPLVLRVGKEISEGLAAAHAKRLVHRDVKPSNVWLEAGIDRVKLLDFGLARDTSGEQALTNAGTVVGSAPYMSPEQAEPELRPIDERSDLFSLGSVLYEMATGKAAFRRRGLLETLRAVTGENPQSPKELVPTLPQAFSDLVMRLLSKDPDDRPDSAMAVIDALEEIESKLSESPAERTATLNTSTEKSVADMQFAPATAGKSQQRRPPFVRAAVETVRRVRRPYVLAVAVALAALLPSAYFYGAQVIRIATNKGQVIIEVDDPGIEVTVKENGVVVQDHPGQREITLSAGEHELEVTVKSAAGDDSFSTGRFTVTRGGKLVFDAHQEIAKAAEPSQKAVAAASGDWKLDRRAAEWALSLRGTVRIRVGEVERQVNAAADLPGEAFRLTAVDLEASDAGPGALKHLEGLAALKSVGVNGNATDEDLAHIAGLSTLEHVKINHADDVTQAGLAHLDGLTKLRNLSLPKTADDAWIAEHRAVLERLETLGLSMTNVTDAGIAHLAGLKNLSDLGPPQTLTDLGMVHLETLTNLSTLDLAGTKVTDAGLVHLRPLVKMGVLNLVGERFTDKGLENLRPLVDLASLGLSRTRVTDAGLEHIGDLKNLRRLDLAETAVTDAGLKHLRGLANLEYLNFARTQVTDAGMEQLAELKSLTRIDLTETRVTAAGYTRLKETHPSLADISWTDRDRLAAEGVLSLGGSVTVRVGGSNIEIVPGGTLPAEIFQLKGVNLYNRQVPNDALAVLEGLTGLEFLNLHASTVTDAGLAHIKGLTTVTDLSLTATGVTDTGLAYLEGLTNLRKLELWHLRVTDAGLAHLKGLTRLVQLQIASDFVTDQGVAHLQGLAAMGELYLHCSPVTDAGLVHLRGMTQLSTLELYRVQVSDDGLKHLGALANLAELNLNQTQVTGPGLLYLKGLEKLNTLSFDAAPVTDAGLAPLREMPQLARLYLSHVQIGDAGLAHLAGLTNLEHLDLHATTRITDAGLAHLRGLTKLRDLDVRMTQVTDAGLANLESLAQLENLNLGETHVTDAGLAHLKALANLRVLDLSFTPVTDAGVSQLGDLAKLEELNLNRTQVTGENMDRLPPNLTKLSIAGTRVTDAGAKNILQLPLERLGYLGLRETRVSPKGYATLNAALPNVVDWYDVNRAAAEAILAAGGSLSIRSEGSTEDRRVADKGDLPAESEYFEVTRVSLAGAKGVPADVWTRLMLLRPAVDPLVAFDLSGAEISVSDLNWLKNMPAFQELVLCDTQVSDDSLSHLQGLTDLIALDLTDTNVGNAGLEHLPEFLPNLQRLDLTRTQVNDAGLAHLKKLQSLRRLVLDGTPIRGRGLAQLKDLPELTELGLACPTLTDVFVRGLVGLTTVERLSLAGSSISDEAVQHLARLTHLKELDISGSRVTEAGIEKLSKILPECTIRTRPP